MRVANIILDTLPHFCQNVQQQYYFNWKPYQFLLIHRHYLPSPKTHQHRERETSTPPFVATRTKNAICLALWGSSPSPRKNAPNKHGQSDKLRSRPSPPTLNFSLSPPPLLELYAAWKEFEKGSFAFASLSSRKAQQCVVEQGRFGCTLFYGLWALTVGYKDIKVVVKLPNDQARYCALFVLFLDKIKI